jgi:hypothetical protein
MSDAAVLEDDNTETPAAGPGLRVPFDAREESRARRLRARLTKLLLAKLTLDLAFVAALAVYTHAVAFRPFYSGSLDYADGRSVRGWVVDRFEPERAVEVQLYIDGRLAASGSADKPRPDVYEKGFAQDERHGFVFDFDQMQPGEHEARVYAVREGRGGARRTLQPIGDPQRFRWK